MWDLSWIWDRTQVSWIGRWIFFFKHWATREAPEFSFLGLLPSSVILPSFRQISYKLWWKWTVFLVLCHTKVEPFGVFDLKEERSLLILSTMSRSPSFPPVLHVPWDYETDTQVHLIWQRPSNSSYFSDSYHHYVSDLRILAFFAAQQCLFSFFFFKWKSSLIFISSLHRHANLLCIIPILAFVLLKRALKMLLIKHFKVFI